jgi:hypothetical protein
MAKNAGMRVLLDGLQLDNAAQALNAAPAPPP